MLLASHYGWTKSSMIHAMRTEELTANHHRVFRLLVLILLAISMFFVLAAVTRSQTDFYNNLWTPVHLLVQGASPYDTASLQPELPALWMPMAVGFFSFLGFFNFETAYQMWFALNVAGMAALLYLSMPDLRFIPTLLAGLFFAYFFPPTINHFALGQISILSALSLLLAARLVEKMPWFSAFFLALGMAKPQIGFLVLFGLCIHHFQQGGFTRIFRYGAQTFLAAIVLSLPLFIAEPNWIPDWIASLQSNTLQWTHPSILSQLDGWLGNWKYIPWGLLMLGALWVTVRVWKKHPPHVAVLWTLALTVIITPYVWSWDFVLLLPVFVHLFSRANWKGMVLLITGYGLVWGGMAAIQLSENFHNSRFWWVPLSFMMVSVLVVWLRLETQPQIER